ncbi:TraR/DksA C4-type zinc finger protein [Schinkia sp. CFF1]
MLTPNELSSLKNSLLQRKSEITRELEATDHFDIERAFETDSVGELSRYDNHPADTATDLYEREKDHALVEHFEEELKDINHALANMEKGIYGICEKCGQEIPEERLKALPTATHCIEHTPDKVVSHQRPVEEKILIPPFGQFEYDEQDATFYDAEDAWQDVSRYGTSETPSDFFDQSMLDYNDLIVEEDENVGYVEDIESFIGTDIEGKEVTIYPNATHQLYEERLDSENVMSVTGNLGAEELESFED